MYSLTLAGVFIVVVMVMTGCSSSSNGARHIYAGTDALAIAGIEPSALDANLEALEPEFTIIEKGTDQYIFSIVVRAGGTPESSGVTAVRSIRSTTYKVFSHQGVLLDSLYTNNIPPSGIADQNGNVSLTAAANVTWKPEVTPLPGCYVIAIVRTETGTIARLRYLAPPDTPDQKKRSNALALRLESRPQGLGVEFILYVDRVASPPVGEYLPNSEEYRIELTTNVGEMVWSSSRGRMFTQAITSVQPTMVGKTVTYREYWDGQSDVTHSPLPPGTYRITVTIPAKPTPYVIREDFNWNGGR